MNALASQATSDSAPAKTQRAAQSPVLFSPWFIQPISASTGPLVQRRSGCACGGGCPSCEKESEAFKVQTKLAVSRPGDEFEQEANAVADQMMRMPDPLLQRQRKDPDSFPSVSKEPHIQRQANSEGGAGEVASVFNNRLGAGAPLDKASRRYFEPRFGHDFGNVRVYTDTRAAESARTLKAQAFTVGSDIVFGKGQYAPGTTRGNFLLAHELAHVVQQTRSGQKAGKQIQRYSHQDCTDADLRAHIWPADGIARAMVTKAIRVLGATPINPAVVPLLSKNFMTSTPTISAILAVFNKVNADFTTNTYQYECEDDCEDENAYVYGIWTDIHLCMNMLRGMANDCIASTIVHEFTHYSANLDDESGRCYGCGSFPGCPAGLSTSDALDNADSYAAFAYELYPMAV